MAKMVFTVALALTVASGAALVDARAVEIERVQSQWRHDNTTQRYWAADQMALPGLQSEFPTDYYGVDVSAPYDSGHFHCLRSLNLRFAIVRCFESLGRPDPNCAGTVAAAHAGAMDRVDAYMFPCGRCGNAKGQVDALIAYFNEHKVLVKTLWLDIEGTQYWTGNLDANRAFMTELVDACASAGLATAIYSSASQWSELFGADFVKGNNLPLWYAHYDGLPEFSDFRSFGGWSKPAFKQFSDQGSKCGVSYDISWGPSI